MRSQERGGHELERCGLSVVDFRAPTDEFTRKEPVNRDCAVLVVHHVLRTPWALALQHRETAGV